MDKQIALLLIGASVTLVVTCLVQIFVVPWVQALTRRRERWERDVIELVALLQEDLPRALQGYRIASTGPRVAHQWRDDPETDQEKLQALLTQWSREQRQADQVVGEKIARLNVLERRISRIRPSAPYWPRLHRRHLAFRVALWDVEPWRTTPPDDDAWEAAWEKIAAQRKELLELVKQIADHPKPPSREFLRRFRSRLASARRRIAARGTRQLDGRKPQLQDRPDA